MMEAKRPATILARIQDVYYENPTPFWVLMTGTFVDRPGTNLIVPFLAIDMDHLICAGYGMDAASFVPLA